MRIKGWVPVMGTIIIDDIPQMGDEWFQAKLGVPSASHFDLIITTNGKPSKSSERYMYQLAYERITGNRASTFSNYDTRRGIENEPIARNLYELMHGVDVKQVALCYKNEQKLYGCSPDGLIDPDGGLEIKDARPEVQIARLLEGWPLSNHFQQIQGSIFITEKTWWDRMSHCPGLLPLIHRYYRDDKFCAALKVELDEFCERLDEIEAKLRSL